MKKVAFAIVTDLHLDFVKANRINYFGEVMDAMTHVLEIAEQYRTAGYDINLILLGDVFDGSLSNASDAMQALEIFHYFCSYFSKVYSVVGNHEITYAQDNPFWFLVSDIQDESLQRVKRYVQPRALKPDIILPDTLTEGNVIFYFNHFGVPAKEPRSGDARIGLFHQNVGSNDICKMWGTFDNVEEAAYIKGYTHCFFGHMHLAKGKYYVDEQHACLCEWLGAIGRTNVDEIKDDNLDVNVPVVLIEDGKLIKIEDNIIRLKSADECIDYVKLKASQKTRAILEERKEFATNAFKGSTLLQTLEGAFAGTALEILLSLLNKPWDEVLYAYKDTLREPVVDNVESDKEMEDNNGTYIS